MSFVRSLLARSALFLAAVVHASAQITCNPKYFNQPQWTCDICGDWEVGGAPIGCQPYNATVCDPSIELIPRFRARGITVD